MRFGFEVIGALLSAGLAVLAFLFLHKREQLKASERRARALVHYSPMAIILTDAETHVVIDVNQAFADMFGLASPDVIGLNADDLAIMDRAVLDEYRQTLAANGAVEGLTTDLRANGGAIRTITISGHRLMLNGRAHVLTFIADVTDDMRAADILRRDKEVAETEARVKSRFLAMMSHDFRTPLSAAAGLAELLRADEPDPARRHRLDGILESTAALAHMVDDILDMSRLQGGGVGIVEAPFDPVILAERVESICGPAASRKGLDLVLEVDPDLPALIRGDPDRLTQMAMNLVQNAIKFTQTGAVTLALGQTRAADEARHLLIEVRDTGPGIDPAEVEGLFEPFRQGTASAGQRGVGLGLAICRQLAGMMGGQVAAAPNPGGGSVFRLTVPLIIAAPNDADTPSTAELLSQPRSNGGEASPAGAWAGLRVLLAEDTALNREVMADQLRRAGAEVVAVGDGAPAVLLTLVADPAFDVVLLDMDMPTLSGPLTAQRLRAHPRGQTPVIAALTAYSEQIDRDAGLAAGMDLFFSKPPDLGDMARRIKACRASGSTGPGAPAAGFDVVAAARGWGDDASPLAALLDRFATTHAGFEGHLTALRHAGRTAELASALHQIVGLASVLHAPRLQSIAEATKKTFDETPGSTFAARLTAVDQAVRTHVDVVMAAQNGQPVYTSGGSA
jgi:PAS domain S-box-containing protein